jgi:hypothetical protein
MSSFLRDYEVFSGGNKASPLFHMWSGISAIASLLSRRVWVQQGFFSVYPNLYVILVGDPACGKSHAMSYARTLIREFPDTIIAPDSVTKEALTLFMAGTETRPSPCIKRFSCNSGPLEEYCQVSIFSNELVTLLGTEPIRMIEFFTDVWDQKAFTVKTKNQGTDIIIGPCVNILGCLTPQITSNLLKSQVISGGFSRRCIFVSSPMTGTAVPRPKFTDEQKAAFARLKERGKFLGEVCGEFQWTPEAEEWFDRWFMEKEEAMKAVVDAPIKHYLGSKDGMLLKVAMAVALSEGDELVLTAGVLQAALSFLDVVEEHLPKVFEGTGRNELAPILHRIADFVTNSLPHPVAVKTLRGAFFSDANHEEMSRIFLQLQETGKVQLYRSGGEEYCTTPEQVKKLAKEARHVEREVVDVTAGPTPAASVPAAPAVPSAVDPAAAPSPGPQ